MFVHTLSSFLIDFLKLYAANSKKSTLERLV